MVWDRATGRAVHPAIVWQDRRTDARLRGAAREHAALVRERTGLELDATFPATKLRWLLDHVAATPRAALAYGDVASWLLHRLAGVHVCDAGNAGRSLLCPLGGRDWDDELLELFGIPRALLPPIVDSDAIDARRSAALPVRAAAGDQQASLFGLRCWEPGRREGDARHRARSCSRRRAPSAPRPPAGILASCAWRRAADDELRARGLHPHGRRGASTGSPASARSRPAPELDALLREPARRRRRLRPRAPGPRAPRAGTRARAARCSGSSLGTTRADLARAVVDGILHQVADAVEAIGAARHAVGRRRPLALGLDRPAARRPHRRRASSARPAPTRPRSAPPRSPASPRASGTAPEALPEIPLDLAAEPRLPDAERAGERERWAAARAAA